MSFPRCCLKNWCEVKVRFVHQTDIISISRKPSGIVVLAVILEIGVNRTAKKLRKLFALLLGATMGGERFAEDAARFFALVLALHL